MTATPTTNHSWSLRALGGLALFLVVGGTLRMILGEESTFGQTAAYASWSSPPACLNERGSAGHWMRDDNHAVSGHLYAWKDDACPLQGVVRPKDVCEALTKLEITRLVVLSDAQYDSGHYMQAFSNRLRIALGVPESTTSGAAAEAKRVTISCPGNHDIIYKYVSLELSPQELAQDPIVKQINRQSQKILLGNRQNTAIIFHIANDNTDNNEDAFQQRFREVVQALASRNRDGDFYFYINAVPGNSGAACEDGSSALLATPFDTYEHYLQQQTTSDSSSLISMLNAWTRDQMVGQSSSWSTTRPPHLFYSNVYNATVLRGDPCLAIHDAWVQLWFSQLLDIIYHGVNDNDKNAKNAIPIHRQRLQRQFLR